MCTLRYLQEVGYADTILDVKSQRVRTLLGLADKPSGSMVNGAKPSSPKDGAPRTPDPAAAFEALKFIQRAAADFSDEDDEDEGGGGDKSVRVSSGLGGAHGCRTLPHSSSFL